MSLELTLATVLVHYNFKYKLSVSLKFYRSKIRNWTRAVTWLAMVNITAIQVQTLKNVIFSKHEDGLS